MKKNMTKVSLYLTANQLRRLATLALRTHRTNASHIREALDEHLRRNLGSARLVRRGTRV